MRYRVALNKNTPLQALSLLAKDEECDIRCTVAENENVLPKTLLDLVQGEDYNVRQSVAGNFSTPVEKNEMKEITLNEYAIHLYSDSNLSEMEKVKKFAEKQWEEQMDCADMDSIKEYGVTAFYDFYTKIIQKMESIYLQDRALLESRYDEAEPDL